MAEPREGSGGQASDLEIYKVISEHFRQDVREFWARSNFYLLVQAGLLSVFVGATSRSSKYNIATSLVLGIVGLVVAIMWSIVARGSILWLRKWREQIVNIDKVVNNHQSYFKVESFAEQRPIMSPSNITQYLPIVFFLAWIMLIGMLIFYK